MDRGALQWGAMNRCRHVRPLVALILLTGGLLAACRPAAGPPPILYVRPDADGYGQLMVQTLPDGQPRALTQTDPNDPAGVVDFAVAPGGRTVAYSVIRADGTTALRRVGTDGRGDRLLLDCPAAECTTPVWAPDGQRLLYERREGAGAAPRLHWLDTRTGETIPLLAGDDSPNYGAVFAPGGGLLSYVSPRNEGVVLYDLVTGEQRLLPSRVGRPAAFSPDSRAVITADIVLDAFTSGPESGDATAVQESARTHLYKTLLDEPGSRVLLSPQISAEDSVPAWSPDGAWVAFGRQVGPVQTGRQLWLMRADGSEARPLTDELSVTHGPPAWSPDGRYLLFQRYDLAGGGTGSPSVWVYELETGELQRVAQVGALPAWGG